ncbi:MAG: protease modulator HflC [Gemmataceae bacterium]
MKRFLLFRLLPVAVLAWLSTGLYTVDVSEFAHVTRFGDPVAIHDGSLDAGLHVKAPWPIDSVYRIDLRLQSFDLPTVESLTRDPTSRTVDKTISADAFVAWRIPDAPSADRFLRTLGTPDQARRILVPQISARLASAIGTLPLDDLVSVADDNVRTERTRRLNQKLSENGFHTQLLNEYGIELVELRLRRLSFPEAVRQSIYERIRSERSRKVAEYESEGRKKAAEILSTAERDARLIETEAKSRKIKMEGEADAAADRIRNDAHALDPEFYAFLQKLKSYQQMLGDTRDVLLLSGKHPLFDLLFSPPKPAGSSK